MDLEVSDFSGTPSEFISVCFYVVKQTMKKIYKKSAPLRNPIFYEKKPGFVVVVVVFVFVVFVVVVVDDDFVDFVGVSLPKR